MFTLPVDCLNIVYSFGTHLEISRCVSVSQEARKKTRECNFAWYEFYTRVIKNYTIYYESKHQCEYSLDCVCNQNHSKDFAKKLNVFRNKTKQACKDIPNGNTFSMYLAQLPELDTIKRNIVMGYFKLFLFTHGLFAYNAQILSEVKMCFNPDHFMIESYDCKKNYRRSFRTMFVEKHKHIKFTESNGRKLERITKKPNPTEWEKFEFEKLTRKKRIAHVVSLYK